MADASPYVRELEAASKKVAESVGAREWSLVFQSRSGPPSQPWLTPDIADFLRENKSNFATGVVIVPIGFLSDHMEVIFDLDVEILERSATNLEYRWRARQRWKRIPR